MRTPGPPRAPSDEVASAEGRWREQTHAPHIARQGELARPSSHAGAALAGQAALHAARSRAHRLRLPARPRLPGRVPVHARHEPNGNRTRLWTMTQVTGFGTGQDWAKRARYMLEQGLQGLIIEHDLPTTNGYDSDHPLVAGEVGRAGHGDRLARGHGGRARSAVRQAPVPDVGLQCAAARQSRDDHRGAREARASTRRSSCCTCRTAILIEYTCVGRYIYPPAARSAHRDRRDRVHRSATTRTGCRSSIISAQL